MADVKRRAKPQPIEFEYTVTLSEEEFRYLLDLTGRQPANQPNYRIYLALHAAEL